MCKIEKNPLIILTCREKSCDYFILAEKMLSDSSNTFNQDAWKKYNCPQNLKKLMSLM